MYFMGNYVFLGRFVVAFYSRVDKGSFLLVIRFCSG